MYYFTIMIYRIRVVSFMNGAKQYLYLKA